MPNLTFIIKQMPREAQRVHWIIRSASIRKHPQSLGPFSSAGRNSQVLKSCMRDDLQ